MKYILDIALILGLCWMGYLWNGEKQRGLGLDDEIEKFKAQVAQLTLDLGKAQEDGAKVSTDLDAAKAQLEQSAQVLQGKTDELAAKAAEASQLQADLDAKVARVKELEGYKAKAIVAEMPKPLAPSAP